MKLTTNYSLKKPEGSDVVNIDDFNYNADMIDSAIQEIKNTSSTNKTNISSLQTKVNDGQVIKVTEDNGACRGIPNNNANDINTTGFFMGYNAANAPKSTHGWVYIESLMYDGSHQVQKATDLHDSSKRWTRHQASGIWSEWREIQSHKLTNNSGQIDVSSQADFNTLTKTGWYYVTGNTNAPSSGNAWYLEVMSRSGGYVYQKAIHNVNNNNDLPKYERIMHNNTWTAWREL